MRTKGYIAIVAALLLVLFSWGSSLPKAERPLVPGCEAVLLSSSGVGSYYCEITSALRTLSDVTTVRRIGSGFSGCASLVSSFVAKEPFRPIIPIAVDSAYSCVGKGSDYFLYVLCCIRI